MTENEIRNIIREEMTGQLWLLADYFKHDGVTQSALLTVAARINHAKPSERHCRIDPNGDLIGFVSMPS